MSITRVLSSFRKRITFLYSKEPYLASNLYMAGVVDIVSCQPNIYFLLWKIMKRGRKEKDKKGKKERKGIGKEKEKFV